jgi:hypothetical protein
MLTESVKLSWLLEEAHLRASGYEQSVAAG